MNPQLIRNPNVQLTIMYAGDEWTVITGEQGTG
jgi:hypothetical protein